MRNPPLLYLNRSNPLDICLDLKAYDPSDDGTSDHPTDLNAEGNLQPTEVLAGVEQPTYQDSTSTNYTYDAGNRLTQVQEKDAGGIVTATITRTYDGLDRLTQEVTAQGQLDYTYDNGARSCHRTLRGVDSRVMACPLRLEFLGANYHITSRDNARQHIILDARDCSVRLLVEAIPLVSPVVFPLTEPMTPQ